MKRWLCRDLYAEIDRLERSVLELEEEIIELKMQLKRKTEETTSLSIENASLRHKVELLERREKALIDLLKSLKVPLVIIDEENFEDPEVDLGPDFEK